MNSLKTLFHKGILALLIVTLVIRPSTPALVYAKDTPIWFHNNIQVIQKAYLNRQNMLYRFGVFDVHLGVRQQSIEMVVDEIYDLLEYVKANSMDGMEPIAILLFDTIATGATDETKQQLVQSLQSQYELDFTYTLQEPPINIMMPLGRRESPLLIDVRADAMRVIIERYFGEIGNGKIPTIDEILGESDSNGEFCDLPTKKDASGSIPPSEQTRDENCKNTGSAGGQNSSNSMGALGTLATGACFNIGAEKQELIQRAQATEQCQTDLAGGEPNRQAGRIPAMEPATTAFLLGILGSLIATAIWAGAVAILEHYSDQTSTPGGGGHTPTEGELDAFQQATIDSMDANAKVLSALGNLHNLEKAEKTANDTLASVNADPNATSQQKDKAREDAEAAALAREAAAAAVEQAQKDAAEKADKLKEEKNKVEGRDTTETSKTSDVLDASGQPVPTSCIVAMGYDPEDPRTAELFGTGQIDIERDLGPVIYPNPDAPTEWEKASEVSWCLIDDNTLNESATCDGLVHCLDEFSLPNASCGCNTRRQTLSQAALNTAACSTLRCPEGTYTSAEGQICTCVSYEESEDITLPEPPVDANFVPSDNSSLVELLFDNVIRGGSISLDTFTSDPGRYLTRSVFLGEPIGYGE